MNIEQQEAPERVPSLVMESTQESEETLHTGLWSVLPKRRRRSATSAESSRNGDDESEKQEGGEYFPATRLFEYQWPLGDASVEHYMLQEQVAEYLDIRGIQRKYPDLQRRSLELEERKYLVGRGVVTETQSNMGLVALRSDEVLELMVEEYPPKYEEYMDVVQQREFQEALRRKVMETKRVALREAHVESSLRNQHSLTSEAVRLTAEYNTRLAEQRRTLRKEYYDNQTKILQIPRKCPKMEEPPSSASRYPVALLPNQYSDYFRRYSADELRSLPVMTVLKLPHKHSDGETVEAVPTSVVQQSANSQTAAPSMSAEATTCQEHATQEQSVKVGVQQRSQLHPEMLTLDPPVTLPGTTTATSMKQTPLQPKSMNLRVALCTVCYKGRAANKLGEPEELIQCANCNRNTHPSCCGMSKTAGSVAKTYPWQCLECKTCHVCGDPDEEDKMVCCDECDRGYHSFCVGLTSIPSGQWLCSLCGICANCGAKSAGAEPNSKWKHEYANGKFLQTLCVDCSRCFRKGYFCPVCLKVYRNDQSDRPMVCCDQCDRWIHTECDGISEEKYQQFSKEKLTYVCCLCRGEVAEKLNSFHKKYRSTE